jgi:hypothetical protein
LIKQCGWNIGRCGGNDDTIERRLFRPTQVTVTATGFNITVTHRAKSSLRCLGEFWNLFDGVNLAHKL